VTSSDTSRAAKCIRWICSTSVPYLAVVFCDPRGLTSRSKQSRKFIGNSDSYILSESFTLKDNHTRTLLMRSERRHSLSAPANTHSTIFFTSSAIQWITFVACPQFCGMDWKLLGSPCSPNASSSLMGRRPGPPSSTVLSVDAEPRMDASREDSDRIAMVNRFVQYLMISGLDAFANASSNLPCKLS
jgi:hypothetical protein